LKINERIRQNQKVYRHSIRGVHFPEPRSRTRAALGKLLPGIPGVPTILKDIRKQFMTGSDKQGNEYALTEEEIDWKGVRAEVEARIRTIPGILPPELAAY
jgi:hypothetical protein